MNNENRMNQKSDRMNRFVNSVAAAQELQTQTIAQALKQRLTEYGMSEQQADQVLTEEVIQKLQEDMTVDEYKIDFSSKASDYPPIILGMIFQKLKPIAMKWIEENKPQAWFKPMFESKTI